MASRATFISLPLSLIAHVLADLVPTYPGPGQSFNASEDCTIKWDPDQSGIWTNVTIDLMSGSYINMSLVTNVISALDGTDASLTPLNWTCPEVDPYSSVYFYQFTNNGDPSTATWTTRFTIASPDGETVPPPNATQPNGDPIPWGTGVLISNDGGDDEDDEDGADPEDNTDPVDDGDGDNTDNNDDSADSEDAADDSGDSTTDAAPASTPTPSSSLADMAAEGYIAHMEEISPMSFATLQKYSKGSDDGDDASGSGDDEDDKKRGGDDNGDAKSDGKGKEGANDKDNGDDDKSSAPKGSKSASSAHAGASSTSSAHAGAKGSGASSSHKATPTEAQDSEAASGATKKPSAASAKPASGSSAAKGSSASSSDDAADKKSGNALAAPTAALPAAKKPKASGASNSTAAASKATHAPSSSSTCSCSPDQREGLSKLMNGGASEVEKVSVWLQLSVPLAIALLVLY